jgi:hypothetical protein
MVYVPQIERKSLIGNGLLRISSRFAGLAMLLLWPITVTPADSTAEETLAAIQDCISHSPPPWPDAWKGEYLDTIRKVVTSRQDATQYNLRLEILSKGFPAYWDGLKKGREKALFELHCAQIRWYVESLMDAELLSEQESLKLRQQYKSLWEFAADSLLMQFPFLDPNTVHEAEADRLAECNRRIEAPLLPIYRRPFSDADLDQIKSRWHDLRYARVDLWRELGGEKMAWNTHHLVAQRSLNQLQPYIWAAVAPGPDYYRAAVAAQIDSEKHRLQSRFQASTEEKRLERQYSRQVFQAEQIAFLLAALLESARCFDESAAGEPPEQITSPRQKESAQGATTHE